MDRSSNAGSGPAGAVEEVLEQIREMLYSMQLLPGQTIRQEGLAATLGVSRAPIREALRILQSQAILVHKMNVGYSVRRLTFHEFAQAYRIRQLLETEVLSRLPSPAASQVDALRAVNSRMADAIERGDLLAARRSNHEFHFALFNASGYQIFVDELVRIWMLTEVYRSEYIHEPAARERILKEHDLMIDAYSEHRIEDLVALADQHRRESAKRATQLLASNSLRTELHEPARK